MPHVLINYYKPKTNTGEVRMNLINIETLQNGVEVLVVASSNFAKIFHLLLATTKTSTSFCRV